MVRQAQQMQPRPLVVICTGYADQQNTGLAFDLHIDYLALKPVDRRLLSCTPT